ncbi:hypothetical protein ACMV_00450 [Acidiphilium multivorum AIU301]|uniref:YqcI/YcgG family protein n=1 Tax=Acidiphilium multivorum (strain DSM 11245 / JCM 8867 / NBRC 100883 / AIU 301) TaxID=926570 RepID=F0J110_ACIMA|nr:YqcI/YcgG family protein [Acidiphilium multivorum]BAJ79392.1 hypothetical protein ACMV_00450 [Acidiphilium multivorum AIU301]
MDWPAANHITEVCPDGATGRLFTYDAVVGLAQPESRWFADAFHGFLQIVDEDGFPCLFAKKSLKDKSPLFLFCEPCVGEEGMELHAGLLRYTRFVRDTVVVKRLYTPLIVFFHQAYTAMAVSPHSAAWQALQWAHDRDSDPWPWDVPLDPEDPNWSYCFGGVQLFINISCATHSIIKSRNLGRYLTLIINPRQNFDVVANGETRSGRLIREKIRQRSGVYNGGYIPPELGSYGDPNKKEWRQYQLSEPGHNAPEACPFKVKTG